eukprot:TRINITY_DN32079_c0_g1_i3.p1 TRINITY_DN32079_c0_g1~~TRINITY_DN32079_c0_g1_i3.p1  ORF type:complete len:473 (+),score=71.82 TRINITY_DN32079_c0_g1_i3:50-1468(+)
MPSDDETAGLAPADGPDWENGFSDSLRRFEEETKAWKRSEEAASEARISGRNLNQRAVASCDSAAEECLKAHFPDRAENDGEGDAPLQSLLGVGRKQRSEIQDVLQLVRKHAEQYGEHTELTKQLPEPGLASQKQSGSDVVALLAALLDVAAQSLSKARKKASERKKRDLRDEEELRGGRDGYAHRNSRDYRDGRDDARRTRGRVHDQARERDLPPRGRDDYYHDDRRREEDDIDNNQRRSGRGYGRAENGYRRGRDDRMANGMGGRREDIRMNSRSRSPREGRRAAKGNSRGMDEEQDRGRESDRDAEGSHRQAREGGRDRDDRDGEGSQRQPPRTREGGRESERDADDSQRQPRRPREGGRGSDRAADDSQRQPRRTREGGRDRDDRDGEGSQRQPPRTREGGRESERDADDSQRQPRRTREGGRDRDDRDAEGSQRQPRRTREGGRENDGDRRRLSASTTPNEGRWPRK